MKASASAGSDVSKPGSDDTSSPAARDATDHEDESSRMAIEVHGLLAASLPDKIARAVEAGESAVPDSTRAAYDYWLTRWAAWAQLHGVSAVPAPPEAFAAYLTELVEEGGKERHGRRKLVRPASLAIACAAVATAHHAQGLAAPSDHKAVRLVIKGLKNRKGLKARRVEPAIVSTLARIVPRGDRILDLRDRALILVGWGAALRRSELAKINVEHVTFAAPDEEVGAWIDLGTTKADQQGREDDQPLYYAIHDRSLCPILALRTWLDAARITEGPVFRCVNRHGKVRGRLSGHDIAVIIKRLAKRAGLDPRQFSGHSLRAGFITEAYLRGKPEHEITEHTRHSPNANTVRDYFRTVDRWRHNAARGLL